MTAPAIKRASDVESIGELATAALYITALPIDIAMRAWALRALFGWFVAPAFHVAPLEFGTAVGIGLIARLLSRRGVDDPKDAERSGAMKAFRSFGFALVTPAVFWCLGWIVQRVAS